MKSTLGVVPGLKGCQVMTRVKYLRPVLLIGLVALVVGVVGVSSASAATAPAIKVCKEVPSELKGHGLYTSSNCGTNTVSGEFAWAWADNEGKATIYCVLIAGGFTEGLCEKGPSGGFSEELKAKAFPKLEGNLLLSLLLGEAVTTKTLIDCTGGTFEGTGSTGALTIKTKITYTGCLAAKPANCQVSNVNEAAGTLTTKTLTGLLENLTSATFVPEVPGVFIEIEYKEGCGGLKKEHFPITGSQRCEFGVAAQTPSELQLLNCTKTGSALKLGANPASYDGLAHIKFAGSPFWKVR